MDSAAQARRRHFWRAPAANHVADRIRKVSAQWFAEILGLQAPVPDGADGDMYNVTLSGGSSVLFVSQPTVPGHHVAFAVSVTDCTAIVDRLRQRGIIFGNDPEDPANGATVDPLGGNGRVYFQSPDGHLLEVTARETS